jgi:hypothetical protein
LKRQQKKAMDMVDVFQHSHSFIITGLAYNQLAQFKKQKKCWKWDWII